VIALVGATSAHFSSAPDLVSVAAAILGAFAPFLASFAGASVA
jgi:hypothetical protein